MGQNLVSTPREDIGASMLIAEDLSPKINVPVEVIPMEELEKFYAIQTMELS